MPKTLRRRIKDLAATIYFRIKNRGVAQAQQGGTAGGGRDPEKAELLRRAAAEGAVLLKNDGTLPIKGKIALLGRCQRDTFFMGYGSGGDVRRPYAIGIRDGLAEAGVELVKCLDRFYADFCTAHPAEHGDWGSWPSSYPEAEVPADRLEEAARETDTAVVVIGRAAGEDCDTPPGRGGFALSEGEEALLSAAKAHFEHVAVILNIGGIMDLGWTRDPSISAALIVWLGGMEAGGACADVLTGKVVPCGKLPTTAMRLEDYPADFGHLRKNVYREGLYMGYRGADDPRKQVFYPFGFGLSYTQFELSASSEGRRVHWRVRNGGDCAGRTVVQIYIGKPNDGICEGVSGSPARELAAFYKTKDLAPAEEEEGTLELEERMLSVYDTARSAFVLSKGVYFIYVGFDSRTADMVGTFHVGEDKIVEQCTPVLHEDLKKKILRELPEDRVFPPCTWEEVRRGEKTVEEFAGGLPDDDLIALSRGALKMDHPLGPRGNAGVMGGTTEHLRSLGVPPIAMTDGPSGVRVYAPCSLLPSATLLAATFDPVLVADVYRLMGEEARSMGSHVMLAPGVNLHRHPLCGRNFEYFSEDPLLAGKMAAAAVVGLKRAGVMACPKHFACNNQENERTRNDSVVEERALRELYLRPFEIAVKEGGADFIMTSYNMIGGVYAHYNYALVRGILREEWKFGGCVITDWWMQRGRSPHFFRIKNNAYRIRAGVNVLMPGGGYAGGGMQYGPPFMGKGGLTRGELRRNAVEVLRVVLKVQRLGETKDGGTAEEDK